MVIGTMFARAIGFMFPVFLTHWQSHNAFGVTYFFIGAGFLVAEFSTSTFSVAMITFAAREGDQREAGRWFAAAAVGSLPAILVAAAFGELISYLANAPPGLMSLVVIGLSVDGFYFSALSALEEYRLTIIYRSIANVGQIAMLMVAVAAGFTSLGLVLAIYSLVYLLPIGIIETYRPGWCGPAGMAWVVPRSYSHTRRLCGSLSCRWSVLWRHFRRRHLPGPLLARHDSATYSAARALAVPLIIAPTAIGTVVQPRTAGTTIGGQWSMFRRIFGLGIAIAVIGTVAYGALAGPLVSLFYGTGYSGGGQRPRFVAGALALLGVHTLLQYWCLGAGLPHLPAISLGCGAVVAVGLAFVLVPALGGSGAALSIGVGMTLAAIMLYVLIRGAVIANVGESPSS